MPPTRRTPLIPASAVTDSPRVEADGELGEPVLFHVVQDGFTAAGRVWYSGDEITFVPGSRAHNQTFDRRKFSWTTLIDDPDAQARRYGSVYLKPGPYQGKKFTAMSELELLMLRETGNPLVPPSRDQAAEAESRRRQDLPEI